MADGKVVISTALNNSGLLQGIKAIKGTLGGLTKVVASATAAITGAFSAAAVAVSKQAVDAYADYQQLMGGVETLFRDSAGKVAAYAEDAFHTVGISANEYMSTVTSFSASLISALGGDTEKAADVANMALVDMADNANKMGTPIESIQNAYQGFAKQNYTMLDNLKLGYGGTKTEMERLLKNAEQLTGVKYDISNLADVYSAIHAIQDRMGITGTTAAEAEKTISGSAAMMKAAWGNVLAAIAGGGDIDKAIDNLVYSITKYFENIVPVVERAISGVGDLIAKVAPALVRTLTVALIKAIPQLLSAVHEMMMGVAQGIYQGIADLFSGNIGQKVGKTASSASDALGEVTDGYESAAGAAEDAEKAADRYLAGFDEITKVGEKAEGTDAALGFEAPAADVSVDTVTVDGDVEISPELKKALLAISAHFKKLIAPLRGINLSPLTESFASLKDALVPFTLTLFSGLDWAYNRLLVPLAGWTIEDLLPSFLDAVSGAGAALNAVIIALRPMAQWLWDSFLQPIAQWTGGVAVAILTALGIALTAIGDWIRNHQVLVQTMTIIVGAFMAVWTVTDLIMWIDAAGGVIKVLMSMIPAILSNTAAKLASKAEDIAIIAMYAKDYIVAFGKMVASLATSTAGWVANTAAKVASTAAEWAQIAATVAWNAICVTATAVTAAFGAAVNFLTSPITLVVLAIAALIAIVVLLVKNWDKVREVAANVWEGIKSVWAKVADWFKKYVIDPIVSFFKAMVNGVIWLINKWISSVIAGVNLVIRTLNKLKFNVPDWVPGIGGQKWGFNISEITAPQIPYLAQGAVLPANKPFLAMVGDQKHGTNVEAPLTTIQEAVAIVMEDMIASNIAGQEAIIAVLKDILEAVLGIEIGEDVIGRAVERYNRKMAVIRGGAR